MISTLQVYQQVALQSILHYDNLEVLHYAWNTTLYDPTWPSWIPRWDIPNSPHPLLHPFLYNADRYSRAICEATCDSNRLSVQGFDLGVVKKRDWILRWPVVDGQSTAKNTTKQKLLTMMRLMSRDSYQPEKIERNTGRRIGDHVDQQFADFSAFALYHLDAERESSYISLCSSWCLLCSTYFSRFEGETSSSPTLFYRCETCRYGDYDICIKCYNEGMRCDDPQHSMRLVSTTNIWLPRDPDIIRTLEAHAPGGQSGRFYMHVRHCCVYAVFFTTSRGHQGSAYQTVEQSDIVTILLGSRVPMILHRHGSAYRLVSDCYIDGLMDGEAVDMWQNGELELQSFEIV